MLIDLTIIVSLAFNRHRTHGTGEYDFCDQIFQIAPPLTICHYWYTQIIRAYGKYARENPGGVQPGGLNLIYAAEEVADLAYMKILEDVRSQIPEHFRFYVVLNRPPLGWTEGVGFIEKQDLMKRMMYPPEEGDLAVMCGPPILEWAMRKSLASIGFSREQWFSFSEDDHVSAHN